MTVRKVWSYWVYESLLGNFSLDFDPIGKDNIMLGASTTATSACTWRIHGT